MPKYYDELDAVLRALADPTRRAVVERLAKSPAVVSELAAPFSMALPSLMQHLRVLEDAGTGHVAEARTRPHREPATRAPSTSCTCGWASNAPPPNARPTGSAST